MHVLKSTMQALLPPTFQHDVDEQEIAAKAAVDKATTARQVPGL